MKAQLLATFAQRATATPSGCWEGVGAPHSKGYRQISVGARMRRAHRLTLAASGVSVDGMSVDHLCRNRGCCNPAHLEAVTIGENTVRGAGFAAIRKRQTHCVNGHAFDQANTYIRPNGCRMCRACKRQ